MAILQPRTCPDEFQLGWRRHRSTTARPHSSLSDIILFARDAYELYSNVRISVRRNTSNVGGEVHKDAEEKRVRDDEESSLSVDELLPACSKK